MERPLLIDLFAGCFGWSQGWLELGGRVFGFDLEHEPHHGPVPPGADLVLQDVRTIDGARFKDAALIVSSSPCQEFSYRAMPWKRAKALGPPLLGLELFAQAFRIQREAIAAAGHFIPMVQENVRGANPWVREEFGRARWMYGSFALWGDVPALMPIARATKNSKGSWFNVAHKTESGKGQNPDGRLGSRGGQVRHDPRYPHLDPNESDGVKQPGIGGERANGKGDAWFQNGAAAHGSKSSARKAASARIARIPLALSRHIARTYFPISRTFDAALTDF